MQYWFATAGRTFGPYSPAEFDALLRSWRVPGDAWVYPADAERWMPVAEAVAHHPPVPWPGGTSPAAPPAGPRMPTNALAVISLVLAVVSIPTSLVLVGFALAVAAVVLAHLALREMRRAREREEPQAGRGLAIAGMAIGYAMVGFCVLLIMAITLLPGTAPTPIPTPPVTDADVRTDLRNAATAEEVVYTDTQEYTENLAVLRANGFAPTSGADFVITTGTGGYCISAFHEGGSTLHYASRAGLGAGPCPEQLA